MAKFFKTSEDIIELIEDKFSETGLEHYGINLKIKSTSKLKDLMSVTKESAKTEYLAKSQDMVSIIVYEELFDRLNDETKILLTEMYLSGISFDSEKDKISVDKNPINLILNMKRKYGNNFLDRIEEVQLINQQMIEEEKERKEAEKAAKKAKKNHG